VRDAMSRRRVLVFVAGAAVLLGTGCGQAAAGHAHPVLLHESAGAVGCLLPRAGGAM